MATGMTSNQRGNELRETASSMASGAADKARHAIDTAQQTATHAAQRAGEFVSEAQNRAKETAAQVGDYLSEQKFSGIVDDATALVRRYPIPAMLVGVGIGVLLACGLRRDAE